MYKFRNLILPLLLTLLLLAVGPVLTLFTGLPSWWVELAQSKGHSLLIIALAWSAIAFIKMFRNLVLSKFDISKTDNLNSRKVHTQLNIFSNLISFLVVLIALSFVLISFEPIRKK